jgi:hypothetical protein
MKQLLITGNSAGWGSNFIRILDYLLYCESNNLEPYINLGPETSCFWNNTGNVWELFFNNPQFKQNDHINIPHPGGITTDFKYANCLSSENREKAERVYLKYIEPNIKPRILDKVNKFLIDNDILDKEFESLHFRGTDWAIKQDGYHNLITTLRSKAFPLSKLLENVLRLHSPNKKLFVMSDNHETVNFIKNNINNVISYDSSFRANKYDGPSAHPSWNNNKPGNPKLAEDVIIETLIASKSKEFIHAEGNTDLIVLLMNSKITSKYIKTTEGF